MSHVALIHSVVFFSFIALVIVCLIGTFIKCYQKVASGTALVRNGYGGTQVSFSGLMVMPVIQRHEVMDISLQRVVIDRCGKQGIRCKDNLLADVTMVFLVRVEPTEEKVKKVAQLLGCKRASDEKVLLELFTALFTEVMKTVGKQVDFLDLYRDREAYRKDVLDAVRTDLNGFRLHDVLIEELAITPRKHYASDQILDYDGIRNLDELEHAKVVIHDKEKDIYTINPLNLED